MTTVFTDRIQIRTRYSALAKGLLSGLIICAVLAVGILGSVDLYDGEPPVHTVSR